MVGQHGAGRVDDDVGADLVEEAAQRGEVREVAVMVLRAGVAVGGGAEVDDGDGGCGRGVAREEERDNVRAEEAAAARDEDGAERRCLRCWCRGHVGCAAEVLVICAPSRCPPMQLSFFPRTDPIFSDIFRVHLPVDRGSVARPTASNRHTTCTDFKHTFALQETLSARRQGVRKVKSNRGQQKTMLPGVSKP